jgi:DNA polymerase-3 subunit gamma/tau
MINENDKRYDSYQPYHHKYRPQVLSQLVGQDIIVRTLSNGIKSEKIMPAYLLTGPRGTGKTSTARILAKSLNCLASDRPTDIPCGECVVCKDIEKGSALDVIEIDAASNTGVDNIRDLIEKSQFAPAQCRYKVYIIDECHSLSNAAFNSLLKTLEEPPKQVIFILATTDPQKVLPTVTSRCQRFDFKRIGLTDMVSHLAYISKEELIDITEESLYAIAQIAQGGLRDAESLLDQISLLKKENTFIEVNQVWDIAGFVPEKDLLELAKYLFNKNLLNNIILPLEIIRKMIDKGKEPLMILQSLTSLCRDILIAKTAPNRYELSKVTKSTWEELCAIAANIDIEEILEKQKFLQESEYQIKTTTQPALWLEITLLNLLSIKPISYIPSVVPTPPSPIPSPSPIPLKEKEEIPQIPNFPKWEDILLKIPSFPLREILTKQAEVVTYKESEETINIILKTKRPIQHLISEKANEASILLIGRFQKTIKIETEYLETLSNQDTEASVVILSKKLENLFSGEVLSLKTIPHKPFSDFVPLLRPSLDP